MFSSDRRILVAAALAVLGPSAGAVDFAKDLAPVLEKKCLSCHNPHLTKGDLSMATREAMTDHGEDLLVPGDHGKSLLHRVAVTQPGDDKPEMPKKGEALTGAEARALAEWIDEGAPWPEGLVLKEASKADKSWWAYQPLRDLQKSVVRGRWSVGENPVDHLIEAKLAEEGLAMNGPAGARTFVRRATYDLTGLPPTPEEVAEFAEDFGRDPDAAVEILINDLLASSAYGERWGRHWLDVVRFGESNGYERNVIISDLWPFRDYVIRSINEDKPFDQFMREHIAGDVTGAGIPEVEIGSAFLVAGPYDNVGNQDAAQRAQIRANTMDEIISATGEAFLGMTLGCARCHDHKFDPITTRDYYGLYATFSGVRHGSRPWATPEQKKARAARLEPLKARKAELEGELAAFDDGILERARGKLADYEKRWTRPPVNRTGTEDRFEAVVAKFVRFVSEGLDTKPGAARGFRMDEFEVWSAGDESRNVALASHGGKASGESRNIEDFPGAYGPQLTIDGKSGRRYFAAADDLTVELAQPTLIDRVVFSSARDEERPEHEKFVFVCEYRIEVSEDGESWREVANGRDRMPVNREAHLDHRLLTLETTDADRAAKAKLAKDLGIVNRDIRAIPPLPTAWIGSRNPNDAEGPHHIFLGGNPQKKGEEVSAAGISTLDEVIPSYVLDADAPEAERRVALAEWITHPENPLTPRVLANRLWHYHFGTGIVDTPSDFGYMGGRPTHPELLDFLASELLRSGWRMKEMHRLIMTSRAYRQSSEWREEAAKVDGDSRLLWRFPPRRLSAEEIRDTMLAVSGKLDRKRGGPGFRLYQYLQDNVATYVPLDRHGPETCRRAVYHQNARASVVDLMTEFDQPDCAFSTPRRAATTTPLQALTMLNHSFTVDMAEALAGRLEPEGSVEVKVKRAFALAWQREPQDDELKRSVAAIEGHGLRAFCRALLNSSEMIHVD